MMDKSRKKEEEDEFWPTVETTLSMFRKDEGKDSSSSSDNEEKEEADLVVVDGVVEDRQQHELMKLMVDEVGRRKHTHDEFYLRSPFPYKLNQLLEDMDKESMNHIISWIPQTNAFQIHRPNVFERDIMPNYFRQTKYKSFTRQVRPQSCFGYIAAICLKPEE